MLHIIKNGYPGISGDIVLKPANVPTMSPNAKIHLKSQKQQYYHLLWEAEDVHTNENVSFSVLFPYVAGSHWSSHSDCLSAAVPPGRALNSHHTAARKLPGGLCVSSQSGQMQ